MNSKLYGNSYRVPNDILKIIKTNIYKYPNSEGIKRAKNIVNSGTLSYQNLKRLKNFFDNTNQGEQFELAGGNEMKLYIDKVLNSERNRVEKSTELKRDVLPDNTKRGVEDVNIVSSIHESEEKEIENVGLKKNVVAIIIDKDKRILLLKRSNYKDQWMPNMWSLPGGAIEDKESPEEALKREVLEETGISFEKYNEKFVVQRSSDNVEHIFTVKYDGEPEDVEVDFENNGFGWFTFGEIRYLNTVPNLTDYIRMGIKNYE